MELVDQDCGVRFALCRGLSICPVVTAHVCLAETEECSVVKFRMDPIRIAVEWVVFVTSNLLMKNFPGQSCK